MYGTVVSLNPYSNGTLSDVQHFSAISSILFVLILILMEHSLILSSPTSAKIRCSLNPYSNGTLSDLQWTFSRY